jgi:hypothetical protein
MKRFCAFNIYLLTLVIFFGSILNVHAHPDLFGSETSESSKEIEVSSLQGKELLDSFNFFLIHPSDYQIFVIYFPRNESHSYHFVTTVRLLNSYRIALPPPQLA